MPPLEADEEVKEEKRLKNLTPNKLLTRLINTNETIKSDKYYIFCISIIKSLKKFTNI